MRLSKNSRSTQELIGIKGFTKHGLATVKGELVFFSVAPTNIAVLSPAAVELKIRRLMLTLSALPELEIICLDSCECYDENVLYIKRRLTEEANPAVRQVLQQDLETLDGMQADLSTARQFAFVLRARSEKESLQRVSRTEKIIADQGFEVRQLDKGGIKRMLAIYFGASMNGEFIPDVEGAEWLDK